VRFCSEVIIAFSNRVPIQYDEKDGRYGGLMSESLLITRIAPPAYRSHLVPRRRILAQLRNLIDIPLTLLSAPAGFGKTTAMLEATSTLRISALLRRWRG
jgi:hypothetical protein